jgi:hypothetical protein
MNKHNPHPIAAVINHLGVTTRTSQNDIFCHVGDEFASKISLKNHIFNLLGFSFCYSFIVSRTDLWFDFVMYTQLHAFLFRVLIAFDLAIQFVIALVSLC